MVFRPLIPLFEERGYEAQVTAREFAQTTGLLDKAHIPYTLIGRHRGRSRFKKAIGLAARSRALYRWAKGRDFDLCVSHGSNDLAVAAFRLGVPHVTMQDYEFNPISHTVNFRLASRILFPEAVGVETLRSYGATPGKLVRYPGMKEEYYLHGFVPDESVVSELDLDLDRIIVTMRTPPSLATYHRMQNPLFDEALDYLCHQEGVTCVVLARTNEQRADVAARALPNTKVLAGAVDGHSLLFYSDLVVSAGGTVNREAAVLGVPAYSVFQGKMGAIDRMMVDQGRIVHVTTPTDIKLEKRRGQPAQTRDPNVLVDLITGVTGPK